MKYKIMRSDEFTDWYQDQNLKTKGIIDARLDRIIADGYFGVTNYFDGIIELKWVSGLRIYTFVYERTVVVALYGGNKNGQDKDIWKAKKIKRAWLHGVQTTFKP
jgi:putative addiction module killer protein